jgi:hypothetical protein
VKGFTIHPTLDMITSRWLLFSVYWTILLLYHGENKLHFSDVIMMSTLFYINSWFFYNADTTIHWWTYCSTRTCCPDSKSVNLWLHGLFVFVCVKWCSTRIVLCLLVCFSSSCIPYVASFSVFFFVLYTLCCQFLWIVHFWLHLRYSLMFIYKCSRKATNTHLHCLVWPDWRSNPQSPALEAINDVQQQKDIQISIK